jgi:hypothetical protein
MPSGRQSLVHDLTLRASGVVLAVVGALAMRHLYHLVHIPPRHDATVGELALAAIGFLGLSFGCGLLWLGAHIHDQVPISAGWARTTPTDHVGTSPSAPAEFSLTPWWER